MSHSSKGTSVPVETERGRTEETRRRWTRLSSVRLDLLTLKKSGINCRGAGPRDGPPLLESGPKLIPMYPEPQRPVGLLQRRVLPRTQPPRAGPHRGNRLKQTGHSPSHTPLKYYITAFNGVLYNYCSHSDYSKQ